ncbi:Uncharacterized WD repeat-containing protein C2E1P5.05 [Serendipita indica DSM 11827]|uniref:Related to RRP9-protein associated with the U3 small nucleolar RNA n=1 Tax=Serendipita indica (strain DSM 11827) TaxID=1109443 RepID=G4TE88_SERID|nr:Uncharacterized WD repeat-containing protein C2E1P5.05 [Serendipita indica DSM 11827]CCA69618.1 related to RRP9-protein associated with the U3 small nucleolar RNA [Serendipita indica DSM 11827]
MQDVLLLNSKKRKRSSSLRSAPPEKVQKKSKPSRGTVVVHRRRKKDEDLTSSGSENGDRDADDLRADVIDPNISGEEDLEETAGEKRLRLAKIYLESVKNTLADGEFDAAELDRDIISSRLQQDVLQHSGKVHIFLGSQIRGAATTRLVTRGHRLAVTGAAISEDGKRLYTCAKDGSVIQWDIASGKQVICIRKQIIENKGKGKRRADVEEPTGHTDELWALALSSDGKYLATGGKDRRVGIWETEKIKWLRCFKGHKDSISGLAFRKGSNQLYSASHDRSVKLFDLSVMGYVETLFGHQDRISDIDALRGETALTSGCRDKSVRYWKVHEETQIVFRGGTKSVLREVLEGALDADGDEALGETHKQRERRDFVEGSIDCVAMVDESTFLSGGDSGTISLWSTNKKKPIFKQHLAHGLTEHESETHGAAVHPRWITSLAALPYSDIFASGSWDGHIRLWQLDPKLKSFSALATTIPVCGVVNSLQVVQVPRQSVMNASWMATAHSGLRTNGHGRGKSAVDQAKSVLVVAAIGQEPRTGRWIKVGGEAKNCGVVVPLEIDA